MDKKIIAVGIDLDKKPILFAQAFSLGIPNLTFINQDIKLYNREFNLITCVETLEHIPDDKINDFVVEIDKHLAKEGILILSVPSKNVKLNKKHYRHYNMNMLKKYFKDYKILEKYYITDKNNFLYKVIEFFLCNGKLNLNMSIFAKLLFYLNYKFLYSVKENKGAHIILVLKK